MAKRAEEPEQVEDYYEIANFRGPADGSKGTSSNGSNSRSRSSSGS